MNRLLAISALLVWTGGCCICNSTKIRNYSGRDIWVQSAGPCSAWVEKNGSCTNMMFIPAGGTRNLPGVWTLPGVTNGWVIADTNGEYQFDNVSAIGWLKRPCVSRSRFTSDFPCLRFTRHLAIDRNMNVLAVNSAGQKVLQTNGFPIHFSSKKDKR